MALIDEMQALYAKGDFAALIAKAESDSGAVSRDAQASFLAALAYATTGAVDRAAPALRRALSLRPGDPFIIGALARTLILLGAAEEAEMLIAALGAAARTDVRAAQQLAEVYLQAGRAEDAFHAASAAVRAFGDPRLDPVLAEAAIRTRRIAVGVEAVRRAEAALGPVTPLLAVAAAATLAGGDAARFERLAAAIDAHPGARAAGLYDHAAAILVAGESYEAARRAAEIAAARTPTPQRWRLISDLRLATRDVAAAEEAARAALAIAPKDADAMTLLARCKMFSGDVDAAKTILREAVAADPDSAIACSYLADIDARAMTPEMAAHLETRLAAKQFSPDQAPKALLALARRSEAEGDFARAFEQIMAAKAILAKTATASGRGYDFAATENAVLTMKRAFPAPLSSPAGDLDGPRFIFVVGMPRSGTSLAEQILASHPDVFGAGELPEMVAIMNEFAASIGNGDDAARLLREKAASWRARYRAGLPREAAAARVVVDKHPLNFWSVGLIAALFPDARIVNLDRSAVDVCLSILRYRFFAEYAFANAVDSVAHYYAAYERMTDHWRKLFPERICEIDYESLVAAPEAETRRLLEFCGLPWTGAVLDFHNTKREVLTHSAAQVREPMHTRAAERRARYGDALRPLEEALARYRKR